MVFTVCDEVEAMGIAPANTVPQGAEPHRACVGEVCRYRQSDCADAALGPRSTHPTVFPPGREPVVGDPGHAVQRKLTRFDFLLDELCQVDR